MNRAKGRKWRNVRGDSIDGVSYVVTRMPADAEPVLVRPGMVVTNPLDGEPAVVTRVERDLCWCQGETGGELPLRWIEVWAVHAAPDPAFLSTIPRAPVRSAG